MNEPICTIDKYGTKQWFLNGKRHYADGPAIEWASGTKSWWLNGKRHRIDGPAVEWADGKKEWWFNGKRHRTDGPAIENPNGSKYWWFNGKQVTEEEFNERTTQTNKKNKISPLSVNEAQVS